MFLNRSAFRVPEVLKSLKSIFKNFGQGLFFTAIDPFFGESYEFLREKAPRLARIADKLLENPEIRKYETFLRENSVPHTGMGGAY